MQLPAQHQLIQVVSCKRGCVSQAASLALATFWDATARQGKTKHKSARCTDAQI